MTGRYVHSFPAAGGGGTPTPPHQTTFVQQFSTPALTWTITHPLGSATPMVSLYDLSGHMLGDADVYAPDNTTVIVSFALPVAGTAVIQA